MKACSRYLSDAQWLEADREISELMCNPAHMYPKVSTESV